MLEQPASVITNKHATIAEADQPLCVSGGHVRTTIARHQDLVQSLVESLQSDHPPLNWDRQLKAPFTDGFLAVLDPRVRSELFGRRSLSKWLLNVDEWLWRLWDPRHANSKADVLLSILWDNYSQHLTRALRLARVASGIPAHGGVLGFVAGLSVCIVLRYKFAGITPKIQVVAVIEKPQSVFDFWGAIDHANVNARNELKAILASGHKIIYHRGVLTHVDRRVDLDVFGPSIDTLVMSEAIVTGLVEQCDPKPRIRRALEIGTGSGLLSCCLAQNLNTIKELHCLDIDPRATACTTRNMATALAQPGVGRLGVRYETGSFKPSAFRYTDLIVCNPPYIPEMPDHKHLRSSTKEYLKAVAGIDLLLEILDSLPTLLSSNGRLLLMLSSLCLKEVTPRIPKDFLVEKPYGNQGLEVGFDVEAVLSSDDWRDFLLVGKRLLSRRKGAYSHVLHPIWVRRR